MPEIAEEPSTTLDRIDLRMLRLLQKDARVSNADLAVKVGVSAATCHRRTQRLVEAGYITAFRAQLDPQKLELGTLVIVGVVLDRSTPESFAIFEAAARKLKIVIDCHLVAGAAAGSELQRGVVDDFLHDEEGAGLADAGECDQRRAV
ncbi:MAG: Lrp/AsnC family transcriptional regulator, partial [Alphaproteobacteria bacterium]